MGHHLTPSIAGSVTTGLAAGETYWTALGRQPLVEVRGSLGLQRGPNPGMVEVVPASVDWLEALAVSDEVFTARFGIPAVTGWVGFPEALPVAVDGARRRSEDPWGTHLFFDDNGALVGFGGFKGATARSSSASPFAPARQGGGIATS